MRILITGASGFVGQALVRQLASEGLHHLRAALRPTAKLPVDSSTLEKVIVEELAPDTNWSAALEGTEAVVHCAARVHVMNETAGDPLSEFRRTNVEGTLALARQAQLAGVRRFIFISSIKVNGEETQPGRPFTADDTPAPADPYGISKMEAEQALRELARNGTMEVVMIRPVLVYGPGVKANFLSMIRWLDKGIPLPLGGITSNRRSLVALDNLVDLICVCLTHPDAAGQVFLVSDGEDLSTTAMLRRISLALGKSPFLPSLPASWLMLPARMMGRPGIAQRLCGSLQVDISKNRDLLGWTPGTTVDAAFQKTVDAYRRA
ncbi:nucleoside-diphosphate sugar epimerase [Herbaspirillum sp. BH-1]|uniref:Nucleoside-diphosphate-sugar epimerase n=1 Tax=Herbaspirillum frisingense TaxID=92645 RepID=A0ABU1PLQ9_9BURK|nr:MULTISPECIES: SDR family oxidoreductase [Herbaspirillum]MDR6586854.1 nucleoside-diphosphate-sugar epimerase [Herbaspirillum frisingense]PLY58116.1 nucleoside-diphosphate sugar epimerase [Herbaspirillum sp. BH-1]